MPTTETQGATRAPDKWPPLTPVQVVAVPSWLARTFVVLGVVLVLEIAAATAWLREASREDTDTMIRACLRTHAAPVKEAPDGEQRR